ncbi:MAG: LysR family transcriptional regulator [Clostridiales bacterium]|nr:LysR family transcriptional regulator [Clostridiales bacterium]
MHIRQLEYFLAVSEQLNFTKAAKQFYISQTAVTLQIKLLEEELGVKLFNRTNRHVELTPAGKTFQEDARAILRRTRGAMERARRADTVFTGHLKIGFVKGYEKTNLSDLLADFHAKYPNISLSFTRENVSELYDGILNGSLDVIFNLRYSMDDLEHMDFVVIRHYPLLAVMPASHPFAHRTAIRWSELKGYPLVDIKQNNSRYGESATISNAFISAGFLPNIQYTSDDIETSLLAIAAGLGYALLPGYITDALTTREKVIAVPLEGEERRMTVIAAWHKNHENTALDKFLKEYVFPMGDLQASWDR